MSKIGNYILDIEEEIERIDQGIEYQKNAETPNELIIDHLEQSKLHKCNQLYTLTDGDY